MCAGEVNELFGVLARTPEAVAELIRDLKDEELRRPGSEGEFSVVENVCHLRDLEAEGYTVRISRITKEACPSLSDFDGGRLAIERDYNSQDINRALQEFAAARRSNVALLRELPAAQFERRGILEGVGEITLHQLLVMMSEHDAGHIAELRVFRRMTNLRPA